mmetsp:Transcript_38498/g.106248  ORF Transcript_38498/g.106248 Transcript_38498/m.106248 type:complete len:211 (-) Transcript_38498:646-1278(-)
MPPRRPLMEPWSTRAMHSEIRNDSSHAAAVHSCRAALRRARLLRVASRRPLQSAWATSVGRRPPRVLTSREASCRKRSACTALMSPAAAAWCSADQRAAGWQSTSAGVLSSRLKTAAQSCRFAASRKACCCASSPATGGGKMASGGGGVWGALARCNSTSHSSSASPRSTSRCADAEVTTRVTPLRSTRAPSSERDPFRSEPSSTYQTSS